MITWFCGSIPFHLYKDVGVSLSFHAVSHTCSGFHISVSNTGGRLINVTSPHPVPVCLSRADVHALRFPVYWYQVAVMGLFPMETSQWTRDKFFLTRQWVGDQMDLRRKKKRNSCWKSSSAYLWVGMFSYSGAEAQVLGSVVCSSKAPHPALKAFFTVRHSNVSNNRINTHRTSYAH